MNKILPLFLLIISFNGNAMQQSSQPNRFKSDTNRFKGPNRFKPASSMEKNVTQGVSNPELSSVDFQETLQAQESQEIIEQFRMQATALLQEDIQHLNDIFERIKKGEKVTDAELGVVLQRFAQNDASQKEAFAKVKALIERQEQ